MAFVAHVSLLEVSQSEVEQLPPFRLRDSVTYSNAISGMRAEHCPSDCPRDSR